MVDAVNAALTDIRHAHGSRRCNGTKAGLLAGNGTLRQVRDQLLSSVTAVSAAKASPRSASRSTATARSSFDADKFAAAYAADPAKVSGLFVDTDPDAPAATNTDHGFATALESLAKRLSNSSDGVVTSLVKGRQSAIDGLKDAIEGWDARLELRRSALERQYGALEVALGKLQSQSSAGWPARSARSRPCRAVARRREMNARNAYVGQMVQTASPARLLVMLLERLARDVRAGRRRPRRPASTSPRCRTCCTRRRSCWSC